MLPNKRFVLFGLLLLCLQAYSQNDILDFIVKGNDTLYGTLRFNGTNKLWFYQKVTLENGESKITEEKLKKDIRTIRKNGKVYILKDKRYQTKTLILSDYVVTTGNDTIPGEVISPKLFGKSYLLDVNGNKHILKPEFVISYRMDNSVYRYLEENPERRIAQKGGYFKLILDGPISLYQFSGSGDGWADFSGIYIRKGEEFQRVYNSGFLRVTEAMFGDDEELMKRIEEREFAVDNIFLVTQIYNRYLINK